MNTSERKTITVGTYVSKPLDEVWELWTNPGHITKWNFASEDWQCPRAENELSRGGRFNWRMEAKDGSSGFDYCGEYLKVVPKEKLVKRLDDGREVNISFLKLDNGTQITETFEAENENSMELQRKGWQSILNNFKAYCLGNRSHNE